MTQQELKNKLLATNYFEDNKYLNKYCNLIISNLETKKEKYKTQKHHIIPKCYFKLKKLDIDNSKENIINILYIDHILAHYYLCLCTEGNFKYRLANAFFHLTYRKWKYEDFDPTQLDNYQEIYENWCKQQSILMAGREVSEETKKKMSKPRSENFKINLSLILKGRPNPKSGESRRGVPRPTVSIALKGVPKPEVSKKLKGKENKNTQKYYNIYCLELDEMFESTFDIIQKYPNLNKNRITPILKYNSTNSTYLDYNNTHWCYGFSTKEESKKYLLEILNKVELPTHLNSKPVQNLETGEVYKSATEAGLKIGCKSISNVGASASCFSKGINKICYGSHWVYLEDINTLYNAEERKYLLSTLPPAYFNRKKIIQNLNTGEVYCGFKEIKEALNLEDVSGIPKGCKYTKEGYNSIIHGYNWIYIDDRPHTKEECNNILKNLKTIYYI